MKKFLLAATVACFALGASASQGNTFGTVLPDATQGSQNRAATENGFDIQFSGTLATWYKVGASASSYTTRAYIYVTPMIASRLAGNQVTQIGFSCASRTNTSGTGTIFISEDINGDPLTSSPVEITYTDGSSTTPNVGTLETPYTIKEGQGFYMGYTVDNCTTNDFPIGVDGKDATPFAGFAQSIVKGQVENELDFSAYGCNLYIFGVTIGEKRSLDNIGNVTALTLPTYSLPVYATGEALPKVSFTIENTGNNKITSIDYALTVNDEPIETKTAAISITSKNKVTRSTALPALAEGYNTIKFTITKVNGEECYSQATTSCILLPADQMVDRKFIVEKATGTWCQYCPTGIVAFEDMEKAYPEQFIGLDLHLSDEFSVSGLESYIMAFSGGYVPMAIINRDFKFCTSPSTATLQSRYASWQEGCKGVATIDLKVANTDAGLEAVATPTFQYSQDNADYSIAFVLLENGLTGNQQNAFAGSASAPGDWGSYKSVQPWTYTHTVRSYTDVYGVEGSVPATVVKGEAYPFTQMLDPSVLKDVANSYVVALLLDNNTGVALNAARVFAADYAGVNEIAADADENAPVEYFNLQGIRVNNPATGQLLIRRQGSKSTKVIID